MQLIIDLVLGERLAFVNSDTERPGRWQALACARRCNRHTSTLPTHAIISGAKMIWCLQGSLLLHFLREKPSQAIWMHLHSTDST
uniref:Uncharacterized protein n=1 Tax=Aegilops tauschii subsp. strangulata TaxID=200361 RepID=A0A453E1F1_AEGTS